MNKTRKYPMPLNDYIEEMMNQECAALAEILRTGESPLGKIPAMKCVMNRLNGFFDDYLENFGGGRSAE